MIADSSTSTLPVSPRPVSGSGSGLAISVVTPTYCRPGELGGLLRNLTQQTRLPDEVVIVDASPDTATGIVVEQLRPHVPFAIRYLRSAKGTAVQRNAGIRGACGHFIAFIDDDVRLDADFLDVVIGHFQRDEAERVGAIVGYRKNEPLSEVEPARWVWYRRLRLLKTFEPGRYDRSTGYPINASRQPPFTGLRPVDFMTTACAVWRRAVFATGLQFDPFFTGYGVLEDAHLSLTAGKRWLLYQCGDARCVERRAAGGRENDRLIGYKSVVNYYYVFKSVEKPLTLLQRVRFWRFQMFELVRVSAYWLRKRERSAAWNLLGRVQGILAVIGGAASERAR